MGKFKDLGGMRFKRLTVLERGPNSKSNATQWFCLCDCGNVVVVIGKHLKSGHTNSCGCWKIYVNTRHGGYNSREYKAWIGMKSRCNDKHSVGYSCYGGRGIKICNKWLNSFENFLKDVGKCPTGLTLDRINNNKGYEPNNCRWATKEQQFANMQKSRVWVLGENIFGSMGIAAKHLGVSRSAINSWCGLNKSWPKQKKLGCYSFPRYADDQTVKGWFERSYEIMEENHNGYTI